MTSRRCLLFVSLLAASLHVMGISQTLLPAQDGLKFIRVARQFQTQPWTDVVRGSDQHPLYPALIALVQPAIALVAGQTPNSWRIAAQAVSVIAYLALLWPLHRLTRNLFQARIADLCVFLFVLLPIPAELGRDSLSDTLGLLCLISAVVWAEEAFRTSELRSWLLSGIAIGFGYLTRPEVALLAVSIALLAVARLAVSLRQVHSLDSRPEWRGIGALCLSAFVMIGSYAIVKGEVSEKLALRSNAALGASIQTRPKGVAQPLPSGLDRAGLDFSAKEESGKDKLKGHQGRVLGRLGHEWTEGIGWIFAPFALWGLVRSRKWIASPIGRWLVLLHCLLFVGIVTRHATTLGYLSGRHALSLVLLSMPFAAASMWHWATSFPARRGLSPRIGKWVAAFGLGCLLCLGVTAQAKAMHPSRWGHWKAGKWLEQHANPGDAVLDTRGWAAFVRGGLNYDYWHVRQALSDQRLSYVVVGSDELDARTPRAETLRLILSRAGEQAASFSEREEGEGNEILIYRFTMPASWEGLSQ